MGTKVQVTLDFEVDGETLAKGISEKLRWIRSGAQELFPGATIGVRFLNPPKTIPTLDQVTAEELCR